VTIRALLFWLAFLVTAIANGALREALLTPRLGFLGAHAVSSLTLSAAILILTWLAIPWIAPASSGQALAIGAGWLGLTLLFEFGFGHYVSGTPWRELLADYNLLRGRIWVLVLLTLVLAPWLMARARGLLG
jgi:hypothetical protein